MRARAFVIRMLVQLYPAAWRREFGEEFAAVLEGEGLGLGVVLNVALSAAGEWLRGEDMDYAANYDRLTKIVSGGVAAFLIGLPLVLPGPAWVALLGVAVIGLSFAFSPRGYAISGGEFRVKRLAGDVVFPLAGLRFVREATAEDLRGSVRLWGSGGLFGYYGWFWSKALGRARWFVTDRAKAVLILAGEQLVVVSPEDPAALAAAMGTGELGPGREAAAGGNPVWWITGVSMAAGLGIGAVAMLYAPGPPAVELTREALVIDSRFYGMTVAAAGVDVGNVRVVDLAAEPGWKPVRRTDGFGNANYRAGNFRTANGRAVKLYTTGAGRLVLLPPKGEGTPVLLETERPEEFAARVRAAWGLPD